MRKPPPLVPISVAPDTEQQSSMSEEIQGNELGGVVDGLAAAATPNQHLPPMSVCEEGTGLQHLSCEEAAVQHNPLQDLLNAQGLNQLTRLQPISVREGKEAALPLRPTATMV